jgi:hypothetical protein
MILQVSSALRAGLVLSSVSTLKAIFTILLITLQLSTTYGAIIAKRLDVTANLPTTWTYQGCYTYD